MNEIYPSVCILTKVCIRKYIITFLYLIRFRKFFSHLIANEKLNPFVAIFMMYLFTNESNSALTFLSVPPWEPLAVAYMYTLGCMLAVFTLRRKIKLQL